MTGEAYRPTSPDDPAALFARLVEPQLDASYRLATFVLGGNWAEAEDAVNDAALRAWQHFADLRDPARFDAWFSRIVVNSCRDRLREHRVRPITGSNSEGVHTPDPASAIALGDALERAMLALSPDHRAVVGLRYLANFPLDEIAKRTGVRTGTVKSRLHFALRALRAAVDADAREVTR